MGRGGSRDRSRGRPARARGGAIPDELAKTSDRGVGRSSSALAEQISTELRTGEGDVLVRRRRTAALALSAMGSLGVVNAYQMGIIGHVPEPRIGPFDADKVDAAGEAYQFLKTPDAAVALANYGLTLVLAGMGTKARAQQRPWIPLALAAKVVADAASALFLTLEQGTRHRRFCSWCLTAAVLSVAMVPQVVPEARASWRQLAGRRS